MKATFIGSDGDDSRECSVFGLTFAKDEEVDVSSLTANQQSKLDNNPTFFTDGAPGNSTPVDPGSVVIPDDWAGSHWKTQAKLAKEISGSAPSDQAAAASVIQAELDRRAAAEAPAS